MKKLIITLIAVFAVSTQAFAETVFAPQWQEFCPQQYINIDTEKSYLNSSKTYWAQRKKTFENRISECSKLAPSLQNACYDRVRTIEEKANASYNEYTKLNIEKKKQMMPRTYYFYHQ